MDRDDKLSLVATTMRLLLFEIYIGARLCGGSVVLFFATRDILDSSVVLNRENNTIICKFGKSRGLMDRDIWV